MKGISKEIENADLRIISLGAGVQSSVMALMGDRGLLGKVPDCAIFSDTGWEPKAVYEHLEWLEKELSFPVYRVSIGNIRDDAVQGVNSTGHRFPSLPFFTKGETEGMSRRQCTNEYKIQPVRQKIRDLLGLKKGERAITKKREFSVEQWIGISLDEITRIKAARDKWIINRWPLLELDMTRTHCIEWFEENYPGRDLGKSSCIGCPYHSDAEWLALTPEEFEDACEFDDAIRNHHKMNAQQFLHRDCIPLREVEFRSAEKSGQISWLDECEGMCGI